MNTNVCFGLIGVVLAFAFSVQTANARERGGFIAGALNDIGIIDDDTADFLDDTNDALGNPVDRAAHGAVDYYAPGAGKALEARRIMRQQGGRRQIRQAPRPAPAPYNGGSDYNNAGYGGGYGGGHPNMNPTMCVTNWGSCLITFNFAPGMPGGSKGAVCTCNFGFNVVTGIAQ